jgi:hypothetical protein
LRLRGWRVVPIAACGQSRHSQQRQHCRCQRNSKVPSHERAHLIVCLRDDCAGGGRPDAAEHRSAASRPAPGGGGGRLAGVCSAISHSHRMRVSTVGQGQLCIPAPRPHPEVATGPCTPRPQKAAQQPAPPAACHALPSAGRSRYADVRFPDRRRNPCRNPVTRFGRRRYLHKRRRPRLARPMKQATAKRRPSPNTRRGRNPPDPLRAAPPQVPGVRLAARRETSRTKGSTTAGSGLICRRRPRRRLGPGRRPARLELREPRDVAADHVRCPAAAASGSHDSRRPSSR